MLAISMVSRDTLDISAVLIGGCVPEKPDRVPTTTCVDPGCLPSVVGMGVRTLINIMIF